MLNVQECLIVFFADACPEGFVRKDGNLVSKNPIKQHGSVTREVCGQKCLDDTNCLSFKHSNTELYCNLHDVADPDVVELYKDYTFCSKIGNIMM